MSRLSIARRNQIIDTLYLNYHDPKFLQWDPLLVVREFQGSVNQEYVALISALFAFGGVKQIIASVREALARLELNPSHPTVGEFSEPDLMHRLKGFTHRIYVGEDLLALTRLYQKTLEVHGSLREHFRVHHDSANETIEEGLTGLIADYKLWSEALNLKGPHFKHMLNSPSNGSTCKRWLMLLKWLIRKDDGIDLGLWSREDSIRADQLLIPLDTHLFRISRTLRLTRMKSANFKSAKEVTRTLKQLDPLDPTRFDFSLCRYGMLDFRGLNEKILTLKR